MATLTRGRKRKANRGSFRKGPDPRRHVFTAEERRRGGITTARKFTVEGRWYLDWWDRCARKPKGQTHDPQEEERRERDDGDAGIPY